VTTISQVPTLVVLDSSKVQVTLDEEYQLTCDAFIFFSPEWRNSAFRSDTKFDPVISVTTAVPASPCSGLIALIEGLAVDVSVVVVAEADVVGVFVMVAVAAVVTVVGGAVGTDSTFTVVIFTVNTFSMAVRFDNSVFGLVRYP
jgi:hypothetical protein